MIHAHVVQYHKNSSLHPVAPIGLPSNPEQHHHLFDLYILVCIYLSSNRTMQAPISAKDYENEGTQLFPFYRRNFKFVPVIFDVVCSLCHTTNR